MVNSHDLSVDLVWETLENVLDPEIPVLTVGDLGIVRGVRVSGTTAEVDITPTYSGCPAMAAIKSDIETQVLGAGFAEVSVRTVFDEAWNTDWMSDRGRQALSQFGIAPPPPSDDPGPVLCPRCASSTVKVTSEFGSTACKALMVCETCLEPFDRFKVLEP